MSGKFHVGKNGPAPCRAKKRTCPLGGEEVHFSSKEKAQEAYEKNMSEAHAPLAPKTLDNGWKTRDEVREELGVSLIAFKYLEDSGKLKFSGPNNDLVLDKDLRAFRDLDYKNGFTPGEHTYEDTVIAFSQKPLENGRPVGNVTVIVPNVKRLTDKKRLEIGRKVWEFSGKDVAVWDKASDEEKLRWSNTHMGRYGTTELEVKHGSVSWTTKNTSASNHSTEDVKLLTD